MEVKAMVTPMTSITNRIVEALQDDPRTKDEIIDVSYFQGTLTLTGTVKSEEARQAAEEKAREDEQVIQVVNELKVK
jgi:osmotically-inducible protein OsmY